MVSVLGTMTPVDALYSINQFSLRQFMYCFAIIELVCNRHQNHLLYIFFFLVLFSTVDVVFGIFFVVLRFYSSCISQFEFPSLLMRDYEMVMVNAKMVEKTPTEDE